MENHPIAHIKKSGFSCSKPYVVASAFFSLLAIVGFTVYGLLIFYDFIINELVWSPYSQLMPLLLLSILVCVIMGINFVTDDLAVSLSPMMSGALYNDTLKSYLSGFTVLIFVALT